MLPSFQRVIAVLVLIKTIDLVNRDAPPPLLVISTIGAAMLLARVHPRLGAAVVAIIFAATEGHLDDVEVSDVERFNSELRAHVRSHGLGSAIEDKGALDDELRANLTTVIKTFKGDFRPTTETAAATTA